MKQFWTSTAKSDLFDYLRGCKFILVVGPQRAGTTIASVMIANDLKYERLRLDGVNDWFEFFKKRKEPCVIHCPDHTAFVHNYVNVRGLIVVMIRRPVEDIIASQERVGWGFEAKELENYPGYTPPISEAKYDYWDRLQKPYLGGRAIDIHYEDLSVHPMWVDKPSRQDFWTAQIEVGKPRGEKIQNPELVK